MVIAAILITVFTVLAMRRRALVPGRWQSVAEISYEFVANMVRDNVGTDGMKYFPFIFTLFMFVLALNMLGMVPYSFSVTSHIIVTFALAAFIFIGVTLIGFWKHGIGFLKFFVPSGVPVFKLEGQTNPVKVARQSVLWAQAKRGHEYRCIEKACGRLSRDSLPVVLG